MLSSRNQNLFPSFLAPLGDLFKALKGSRKGKVLPPKLKFRRKKAQSDSVIVFSLSFLYSFALLVCFAFLFLSQSSFMLCVFLYVFVCFFVFVCLFVCFFVFFCFILLFIKKKKKKWKIQKLCVYMYIGTCVPWMVIETKFSKLCISYNLDVHLNAQLSERALWLVFMMSTIKIVSYILYLYHSFWWEGYDKGINNHLTTKARQSCITSVCLGTSKLRCFSLHKWVFLFSLLYAYACYA